MIRISSFLFGLRRKAVSSRPTVVTETNTRSNAATAKSFSTTYRRLPPKPPEPRPTINATMLLMRPRSRSRL